MKPQYPDTETAEKAETTGQQPREGYKPFIGLHSEVTERIIGAFRTVYNELGMGFSEKVYHSALMVELRRRGLEVQSQVPIDVYYRGESVGVFFADIVVNQCVLLELKAGGAISDEHRAQLVNYLKATKYEVGLLLCSGLGPKHERKLYENRTKGSLSWTGRQVNPDSQ